jgi:hypothetical protein
METRRAVQVDDEGHLALLLERVGKNKMTTIQERLFEFLARPLHA